MSAIENMKLWKDSRATVSFPLWDMIRRIEINEDDNQDVSETE